MPETYTDAELEEHVTGILFDALEAVNPDCLLCKEALTRGVWQRYGHDDPFSEDDDD